MISTRSGRLAALAVLLLVGAYASDDEDSDATAARDGKRAVAPS